MKGATGDKRPKIFIDSHGKWFQDGVRIAHRWTYLENCRNLDADEDGRLFVGDSSGAKVYVECEDVPFVVTMVNAEEDGFSLRLNDETREKLDFGTFSVEEENVPYVLVKNGKFRARFSRPAYYEFMKHILRDEKGFYVENRGEKLYVNDP